MDLKTYRRIKKLLVMAHLAGEIDTIDFHRHWENHEREFMKNWFSFEDALEAELRATKKEDEDELLAEVH